MRIVLICLLLVVPIAATALADATTNVTTDATTAISTLIDTMTRDQALDLSGEQVLGVRILPLIYAGSDNAPLWTDSATVRQLLDGIEAMADDGLDPADYHAAALKSFGDAMPDDPDVLANRDVLLTDAFGVMLYHLAFGKADPQRLDQDWTFDELFVDVDLTDENTRAEVATTVRNAIVDGDLGSLYARVRPQLPIYRNLRAGYKQYRDLEVVGGWEAVPEGATLREGDTDPRANDLRRRLQVTGDFAGPDTGSSVFDADLAAALTGFQARHGLTADGIAGKRTIAALNVPVADRVDQIRVNLERARWGIHHEVDSELVLVNIASYQAWLIRGNKAVWQTRVQVGKPFTRTPVFTDLMIYLEFNPTWTVPASISNKSTLQHLKKDPGYLATKNMVLLASDGSKVDPLTVDWSAQTRMPYTVRQEPGPTNALGRVKFIFPNKHAVYLHDTPSRQHFKRSDRAFSHGCIRAENPLELAALLLDDKSGWSAPEIDAVIASGKRTRVNLSKPIPVILLYWTAYSMAPGSVNFRTDFYDRDAPVLRALNGPLLPQGRHEG